MVMTLVLLGVLGWSVAAGLYLRQRRHVCPIEPPTRAVLVNYAGLPESCRALRGAPPKAYSRPNGSKPATEYRRVGTAALYQATAPRQPR